MYVCVGFLCFGQSKGQELKVRCVLKHEHLLADLLQQKQAQQQLHMDTAAQLMPAT